MPVLRALPVLLTLLATRMTHAAPAPLVLPLWPGDPPGGLVAFDKPEHDATKPDGGKPGGKAVIRLTNIQRPEMHVVLPPAEQRNGGAIVVCPGGGYGIVAWNHEGTEVADFFAARGYVCGVVKYRVPPPPNEPRWKRPVEDATRAVVLMRERAAEWGVATNKVGILGFSAGGDTAVRTALADRSADTGPRPNFVVLVYPAYQVKDDGALRDDFTLPADAPPVFFAHARDDGIRCTNSERLDDAWRAAGRPSELLLFDKGGHGFGMRGSGDDPGAVWPVKCAEWLEKTLR